MSVQFATKEFKGARGYYTEYNITIVLDNLMRRKNENTKYVAKRINEIFLQEFLCRETCKITDIKCYWNGGSTCPFLSVLHKINILN